MNQNRRPAALGSQRLRGDGLQPNQRTSILVRSSPRVIVKRAISVTCCMRRTPVRPLLRLVAGRQVGREAAAVGEDPVPVPEVREDQEDGSRAVREVAVEGVDGVKIFVRTFLQESAGMARDAGIAIHRDLRRAVDEGMPQSIRRRRKRLRGERLPVCLDD